MPSRVCVCVLSVYSRINKLSFIFLVKPLFSHVSRLKNYALAQYLFEQIIKKRDKKNLVISLSL